MEQAVEAVFLWPIRHHNSSVTARTAMRGSNLALRHLVRGVHKRASRPSFQLERTILSVAARRPPVWRIGRHRIAPKQEQRFD